MLHEEGQQLVFCTARLKALKPGQPSPKSLSRAGPWWRLWQAQGPAWDPASLSRALKPGLSEPAGKSVICNLNSSSFSTTFVLDNCTKKLHHTTSHASTTTPRRASMPAASLLR